MEAVADMVIDAAESHVFEGGFDHLVYWCGVHSGGDR